MFSVSGRGVYGEEELGSRRTAALHISGVLQGQSVQHPHPLHSNNSAVRSGKREERGGGKTDDFFYLFYFVGMSVQPMIDGKIEFVGVNP